MARRVLMGWARSETAGGQASRLPKERRDMFKLLQQSFKGGPPVQWTVPDDMTLEQARVQMVSLLSAENVNHHRLGVLYSYVVDKKLAELAGHKDAWEWAQKNLGDVSRATLTMYGAVARKFSEEVAGRFTLTSLYLLLTYKELAAVKVDHDAPGDTPIDVPDAKGVVTSKAFSECSVEEMRRALQAKRKPASSKPLPPEAAKRAEQISKVVMSCFAKDDPVRVQLRNHQGAPVVDVKGIPLEKWDQMVATLKADAS